MVTRLIHSILHAQQLRPVWQVLFAVWITFVLYASLVPVDLDAVDVPMIDKLMHFLIHAASVLLAALAFPQARAFAIALGGLLLFGPAIELLQGLTPHRSASLADQLANSLGFVCGWLTARHWRATAGVMGQPTSKS